MSNYYLLKKEIIAKNIDDGFDEIIIPRNAVIKFNDYSYRFKGNVNNNVRNVFLKFSYQVIDERIRVVNMSFKKQFILKTYEFTINKKFFNDFIVDDLRKKDHLLIDLYCKINEVFLREVKLNKAK